MSRAASHVHLDPVEVGPPSLELHSAAKFARIVGAALMGLHRDIALRWYREDPVKSHGRVMGYDNSTVWLRQRDTTPEEIVRTVVHELQHLDDHDFLYSLGQKARERRARDAEAKWSPTLYRAGLAVDWDADRVTLIADSHPSHVWPSLEAKRGDVAISRDSGRAWERGSGNWMELSTW